MGLSVRCRPDVRQTLLQAANLAAQLLYRVRLADQEPILVGRDVLALRREASHAACLAGFDPVTLEQERKDTLISAQLSSSHLCTQSSIVNC